MPKPVEVGPSQLVLTCLAELMPENRYPEVDPEQRISLRRLLPIIAGTIPSGIEPSIDDYFHAEPSCINRGLYIHPRHPQYHQAQHAVRLGVYERGNDRTTDNFGVVFPATEHQIVAYSARGLGFHSVSKTTRARASETDKDEVNLAALRSAGHTLQSKIHYQGRLAEEYLDARRQFIDVYRDIREPSRTRFKAKNIEKRRAFTDEKIHETIEVASIFLELDNVARLGLHKATRKNLYNGNYSGNQAAYNWMRSIGMVGLYTSAKLRKLELSRAQCEEELKKYQPYLDMKTQEANVPAAA